MEGSLMESKKEREMGEVEDERCEKGEQSGGSEVQDLECHEKLELEILELEIALERRREARAWRKQGRMEKLEELVGLVEELEELERQQARVESVRRKLKF